MADPVLGSLADAIRDAVRIGRLGVNSTELTENGRTVHLTPGEAQAAADGLQEWMAAHDKRIRDIALAVCAPRRKVGDPIVVAPSKHEHGLLVRPCSRKHREMFLRGYLVLSCSKCSIQRLEDAEVSL